MKIMIVTDAWYPQVNGVVTTLNNTIGELKTRGHDVFVVHPGLFRSMPMPGYSEISLSLFPKRLLTTLLDGWNPDKVHIATEGPLGLSMRRILFKRGEKWSSSFHTKFAEYVEARLGRGRKLAWSWLRYVYRDDSMILVTTESMRQELITNGFKEERLIVWGRGVDNSVFKPSSGMGAVAYRPLYMNVGRVSVEKNLEAFYDMDLSGTKVQIGDGPMLEAYKAKYPDVMFLGTKQGAELARWYASADVMVFPSKSDTFGLVMIEAMRCGTPVAAYPVTGPIDIIVNGKNGYMDEDLSLAATNALKVSTSDVLANSQKFTWFNATNQFELALVSRK